MLIRKGSSSGAKSGVNAGHFGQMGQEAWRLEMGQKRLLFPDPNLCP